MIEYYRVVTGTIGICEAVDRDCPKDDLRWAVKPVRILAVIVKSFQLFT